MNLQSFKIGYVLDVSRLHCLENEKLTKTIKCTCGRKDVLTPKTGQRVEDYLQTKECPNCHNKGNWRILSDDEARFD